MERQATAAKQKLECVRVRVCVCLRVCNKRERVEKYGRKKYCTLFVIT